MSPRELARLAQSFQTEAIVPHCAACEKPCCRLETLVLELDWRRLRALWRIAEQRSSFDALLAKGEGPAEIRSQEGFYYAYRRVCPAYDEGGRSCRVYGSSLKPPGCTDFPVYEQEGAIVADLRCDAVVPEDVERFLHQELGSGLEVRREVDPEFAFLVTLRCRRKTGAGGPARGRAGGA